MNKLNEIYKLIHGFKIDKKYFNTINLTGEDYDMRRGKPALYIKLAVQIGKLLDFKTVVEIGSERFGVTQKCLDYFYDTCSPNNPFISPPCCCDGHSTFFWANEGFETYTVDINPDCKEKITWCYNNLNRTIPDNLHIHVPEDGIEFLKNFDKKIDILYLDGWDVGTSNYAENHLIAYITSIHALNSTHLILIDDTDFICEEGGKDKLLTPYLLDNNYIPLVNGRQSLFLKY